MKTDARFCVPCFNLYGNEWMRLLDGIDFSASGANVVSDYIVTKIEAEAFGCKCV